MLYSLELVTKEGGDMTYNLLTCAEMVMIAYAQSQAFNWTQFQGSDNHALSKTQPAYQRDNCCVTLFKILFATKDVLDDAHNTFLKDEDDDPRERETQFEELNRGKASFNWSDEEEFSIGQSVKYSKKKRQSSKEKQSELDRTAKQSADSTIIKKIPAAISTQPVEMSRKYVEDAVAAAADSEDTELGNSRSIEIKVAKNHNTSTSIV